MPKGRWQQCQRNDNASAATTEGRHAPRQRNDCQWDAGDDASGEGNSYTQLQAAVRSDHRLPSYGILHTYDQEEGYCR
jgi:hypothetical protein